jgi:hypothetical protein
MRTLSARFTKLHMGLVVLLKKMSVFIHFLLQNTKLVSVLNKICPNFAGHVWQDWQISRTLCLISFNLWNGLVSTLCFVNDSEKAHLHFVSGVTYMYIVLWMFYIWFCHKSTLLIVFKLTIMLICDKIINLFICLVYRLQYNTHI